jgi:hypothetical protein
MRVALELTAAAVRDLIGPLIHWCISRADSSDLSDLRDLFTQGVHRSDVLVVLATENGAHMTRTFLDLTARRFEYCRRSAHEYPNACFAVFCAIHSAHSQLVPY